MRDDTLNVFSIPSSMVADPNNIGEFVPATGCTAINLLTSYKELDLDTVKRSTAWYKRFGQSYHVENATWTGDLILNSCKENLRLKIVEACKNFSEAEKGGPTYFFLLMNYIVATSETALRGLTSVLNKLRLKDFDGENVLNCVSFVKAAITLLKDNNQLPNDTETTIYEIFGSSSCPDFNNLVGGFKLSKTLKLRTLTLDEILTAIEKDYQDKIGNEKWPAKEVKKNNESTFSLHSNSSNKTKDYMCDNCGALNKHKLDQCPEPKDEKAIKVRRAMRNAKGSSSTGGGGNKGSISQSSDKSFSNGKSIDIKKVPPKSGESHEKKIKGKTHYWCGKCGRWVINHKTSTHKTREELAAEKAQKPSKTNEDAGVAEAND